MHKHLYLAQRYSAMLLAPMVIVHLVLILFAVRNGLTGEEILARTQGNFLWAAFYTLFVLAAGVHAPIGLRSVLREWTSLGNVLVDIICCFFAALMLVTGIRAVIAII